MKSKTLLYPIILIAIFLSSSCQKKSNNNNTQKTIRDDKVKIYIKKHEGDYSTSILNYHSIERSNSIDTWFDCIISNCSDKNISVINYGIVEDPGESAIHSYIPSINGLYDTSGLRISMPVNIEVGFSKGFILQTETYPSDEALSLIENHFKGENKFLMSSAESLLVSKNLKPDLLTEGSFIFTLKTSDGKQYSINYNNSFNNMWVAF